ncbi:MAG: cysteine--tRNA ligase [Candidatus Tyrphobacter sp.]
MNLYNTRTRRVETLEPMDGKRLRIYVCGLTPSAQAHLGHARSFLFFDILRRYLEHKGYDVTYVQNVTDVDDRSIATAHEEGTTYRAVIERNYGSFKASMRALRVREPDEEPYATAFIPQIQEMIRALVQSGNAYAVRDGVYYAVRTFARYGTLSNRNIEELEAGARIEIGEHKRDPLDFALWKFAKEGEPSWPFDGYGAGRPGWHIECSAMSRALLDPQGIGFDIHGGGADLIFPHHENEIAQSEPLMAKPPMAKHWSHGGLLLFEGKKMSKSLGNFEPLSELLQRYDPQAIRVLFLQTGYRKVMNFTPESIAGATVTLERLKKTYRASRYGSNGSSGLLGRVEAALDDDVNTAVALAHVLQDESPATAEFETALRLLGIEPNEDWLREPAIGASEDERARIVAGLRDEGSRRWESDPDGTALQIVQERTQARARKDWARADALKKELTQHHVGIKDAPDGTTQWWWERPQTAARPPS